MWTVTSPRPTTPAPPDRTTKLWSVTPVLLALFSAFAQAPRIHNFSEVEPGLIYRGAQPSTAAMADLKRLGVATILDLRGGCSVKREKRAAEALGIRFISFPLSGLLAPHDTQIAAVLNILETAPKPLFVHCWKGDDRTGVVLACWRIRHDGWSNLRALDEAERYHMSHFEIGMRGYIKRYK
jgi:tyrosine-protein phosphatase SIW14